MIRYLLIFAGGGVGSVLRYLVATAVKSAAGTPLPVGTIAVNAVGCAVIGFLAPLLMGHELLRDPWRVAILVGVLGGFTTFSSYAWESVLLAQGGKWALAAANVLISNTAGLLAVYLGHRLATAIHG